MSGITTHILDTSRGRPAEGVPIVLELQKGEQWTSVGSGKTNSDGRLGTLIAEGTTIETGTYRITFDTKSYFDAQGITGFYPVVHIVFTVAAADEHYHVPLLLNPFGYSTYRGS